MVVFTCGHCGESVQKPKVEKHYLTKCRNKNPNLSCMDCFKDFLGQDYESHIKCITEEERYSGKGFTPKEKKGEKKQNTWVEMLQSVLDEQNGAPKNVLRIIESISKHTNTPRKKPKFINFVKNVCGHKTNPSDIDQAWDLISVKLTALSAVTQNGKPNNNVSATNGEKVIENNKHNNEAEDDTKTGDINQNAENKVQNGDCENTNEATDEKDENEKENIDSGNQKKLTKKQRKQEKKRQKYEAELQSAAVPHENQEEEETEVKKGKKKKNRTESTNGDVEESEESKKQKKRKRQDTVNSVNGVHETEVVDKVNNDIEVVVKEKTKKKKQRVDSEKGEESVCLHDQNVATIEESVEQGSGKFNWHAVIMSVLEKKGNEVPFKRLQKKVLSEYSEATGREVDDRIAEKFIKKLKSAPNVRVDKNRVLVVE